VFNEAKTNSQTIYLLMAVCGTCPLCGAKMERGFIETVYDAIADRLLRWRRTMNEMS